MFNVRPSKLKPFPMEGTVVVQIPPREKNLQNNYCIFEFFVKVSFTNSQVLPAS